MVKRELSDQALYLKYRSKTLDDVVGQSAIINILKNALKKSKISHAYLFTGPRGVGKTSVARILAHEITGLGYSESGNHPDIIEIDAASNRRIDDIRELRDKARISPVIASHKVYIIDEVHMLTGESFNAFLKILEEPPRHVVFILATTDIYKLPDTVISRTQRFQFQPIKTSDVVSRLKMIAEEEKIPISGEAIQAIALNGRGSFRDSISLLDQLSNLSSNNYEIGIQDVADLLGHASSQQIEELVGAYISKDVDTVTKLLASLRHQSVRPATIADQIIDYGLISYADDQSILSLVNDLLEVGASTNPEAKLTVVMLQSIVKKQKSTMPERVKQAVVIASESNVDELSEDVAKPSKLADSPVATNTTSQIKQPFADWNGVVAYAKKNHVALASILTNCSAEVTEDKFIIYTGTSFWKRKLDSSKYQSLLHKTFTALSINNLQIETVPDNRPLSSPSMASVVELMGGGVEIDLEGDY